MLLINEVRNKLNRTVAMQIQEKSKLSSRITSDVITVLVEAFNADEYKQVNSLCFQTRSLSAVGASILKQLEDNQVEIHTIFTVWTITVTILIIESCSYIFLGFFSLVV